jgi:hypothetical protein
MGVQNARVSSPLAAHPGLPYRIRIQTALSIAIYRPPMGPENPIVSQSCPIMVLDTVHLHLCKIALIFLSRLTIE